MSNATIKNITEQAYAYGFSTEVETEQTSPGLNQEVVRTISLKKKEPEWLLDFRLKA